MGSGFKNSGRVYVEGVVKNGGSVCVEARGGGGGGEGGPSTM